MTPVWQASVCPPAAAGDPASVRSRRGRNLEHHQAVELHRWSYAEPKSGTSSTLLDPSTGEPNFEAPVSGAEDVDAAMDAATAAFRDGGTDPLGAQPGLFRIADAIEARPRSSSPWRAPTRASPWP